MLLLLILGVIRRSDDLLNVGASGGFFSTAKLRPDIVKMPRSQAGKGRVLEVVSS